MHPIILRPLLLLLVLALLLHAPTPTSALGEVVGPDSVSLYTQAEGSAGGTSHSIHIHDVAYGYFVAGSTLPGLNGVYGPKLLSPEDYAAEGLPLPIAQAVETVAYKHDSSGWWLVHAHNPAHRAPGPGGAFDHTSEPEWVFIDSTWTDRFVHRGDTPVHETSANEWRHVHDRPPRFAAPAGADEGGGAEKADGASAEGAPPLLDSAASSAARAARAAESEASGEAAANAEAGDQQQSGGRDLGVVDEAYEDEDDDRELPWQIGTYEHGGQAGRQAPPCQNHTPLYSQSHSLALQIPNHTPLQSQTTRPLDEIRRLVC